MVTDQHIQVGRSDRDDLRKFKWRVKGTVTLNLVDVGCVAAGQSHSSTVADRLGFSQLDNHHQCLQDGTPKKAIIAVEWM